MRHLALVGATASGKSEVAMAVARAQGDVEVVAVDSMQVYRGMDIGTAKPSAAERAEIRHHLLDVVEPGDDWDVATFARALPPVLSGIEARGHRALLVGGTALYFHAAVDGLQVPPTFPAVRARLDADLDTTGLHRRLLTLDPQAASRMEPTNRRRVVRALEVTLGSGRPFSSFGPGLTAYPPTPWRLAGLWVPRPLGAARIVARFTQMLAGGLVEEVRGLLERPGGLSRTARQALGYREVLAHLEDGLPLDRAAETAIRRTRAFARRQRVWWRRDPRLAWYGTAENPLAVVPALLRDWNQR